MSPDKLSREYTPEEAAQEAAQSAESLPEAPRVNRRPLPSTDHAGAEHYSGVDTSEPDRPASNEQIPDPPRGVMPDEVQP